MAIKRYVASADNTITNAFQANLTTRGTASNMGAADVLEVFSIYGQANTSSLEKSRVLVQFPINTLSADITNGTVPSNASYYLRLFNVSHGETLPTNFTLQVKVVTGSSWDEGTGLDMNEYSDIGYSNWIVAKSSSSGITNWSSQGGDYYANPVYTASFDTVVEDLPKELVIDRPWGPGDNPKTAVWEYLKTHPEFEIEFAESTAKIRVPLHIRQTPRRMLPPRRESRAPRPGR
jgi:hypothetical protein